MSNDVKQLFRNIRLLALDCDGVLTDGGVYVLEDGTEFRRFDIKDGLGLKRVMERGIEVAIISNSTSTAVAHRAGRLGIKHVRLGVENKLAALQELCSQLNLSLSQVAYIGDDLTDVPVLNAVGLPCAPADAVEEVRYAALYVTRQQGGHGAIREVVDWILELQGNNSTINKRTSE